MCLQVYLKRCKKSVPKKYGKTMANSLCEAPVPFKSACQLFGSIGTVGKIDFIPTPKATTLLAAINWPLGDKLIENQRKCTITSCLQRLTYQ